MHTRLTEVIKLNAKTFSLDEILPKLPIPKISDTFHLYLKSVKAIVTDDLDDLEFKIKAFIGSEESKKLQTALISRSEYLDNWLEEWWLKEAYLKFRDPLIPFWNIAGRSNLYNSIWPLIDTGNEVFNEEIIRRSSKFIYSLLKCWLCLRLELIVINETRDKKPLSMSQMRNLFNSSRIPNISQDSLVHYFRTASESSAPSHIIVGCIGRIFIVHGVAQNDNIHSHNTLRSALKEIVDFCKHYGTGPAVATLSSLPRDKWAENYNQLRTISTRNAENIDLIQSSIFWICLNTDDSPHPQLLLEKAMKTDCRNIWADKSLYVSFYKNGLITYGADHAPIDGIALVLAMTVAETEIAASMDTGKCVFEAIEQIQDIESPVKWKELNFDLNSNVEKEINNAYSSYMNICKNVEAQTFVFSTFSRKISRAYKLHPDTVFQLCLQLAYARIHGVNHPASVYETATTRQFRRGRTETIRSCTIEAVAWIKAIVELGPNNPKVVALFLKAHGAHNEMRHLCETGRGFDRHLFGLICVSKTTPELSSPLLKKIIDHPSWAASGSNSSFLLSTSPMGAADGMGAVAPMTANGYGVFYRIVEDCCEAGVTSWRSEEHGKGSRLLEELNCCFRLLPLMIQAAIKSKL